MSGARIFLSYARPTLANARRVAEGLQQAGHSVWMDDQLLAHRPFAEAIEEQLGAADAVLVLWSTDAVRSEWVRSEANRGREAGKLVQLRIDDCPLPMPFDQIHCIDIGAWTGDHEAPVWRAVLASLHAARNGPAQPGAGSHQGGAAQVRSSAGRAPSHIGRAPSHSTSAPGSRPAERRQVTSLACEIADYPALSARIDPEDLLQVIDAFHATCEDIIPQFSGTIARRTDHGVLAHFGYPLAHEEEGANAVRAGLALRDAMASLDLPPDLAIPARVGIATGMVLVGELSPRGSAQERGIIGETPNLALNLASVAAPRTVAVAETTRRITEGMFAYRDLGTLVPPGQTAGVRGFEALKAHNVASRSHARAGRDAAAIFGREGDLAHILERWQLAEAGEGQVVLVQGEAGIGKSGLVDVVRRRIVEGGHAQVAWTCGPNLSARALHPVIEQIETAAGFERGDGSDARLGKLAALLERAGADNPQTRAVLADLLSIPSADPAPMMTPERRRALTLETLLGLMGHLAAERPVLFTIEDLHWADPSTLELLDRAAEHAIDHQWLLLATARPDFSCAWGEVADVAHVRLSRLEQEDARRICARVDPAGLLPGDVVRQILARADGNPLFVEEITRSVMDSIAATLDSAPDSATPIAWSIPDTLQDSLIARLDRLGSARQVACIGAAIGRSFPYDLLAAVADLPAAELRQALRELSRAGVVDATGLPPNSTYRFRHALMRDAAYDSMPKRQREALHGRIADALKTLQPGIAESDPAQLADHLTRGGAGMEAMPLWAAAGQQAAGRAAHAEAAGQFRTALDLLRRHRAEGTAVDVELQLLIGLAVSLSAVRGYSHPDVGAVLGEARTICDVIGNVAGLFAVLRGLCAFSIVSGDLDTAEDLARRCLEIGTASGEVGHLIEGHCPLGYVLWAKGRIAEARGHLEEAVRLYVEKDGAKLPLITPQDPLVQCLGPLQALLLAIGDDAGAERASEMLLNHAEGLGESFSGAAGHFWYAFGAMLRGDHERAVRHADIATAMCDQHGYTSLASFILNRCYSVGHLGKAEEALASALKEIGCLDRLGQQHTRPHHEGEVARLYAETGDFPSALEMIDKAIATAHRYGEHYWLSTLHGYRARILAGLPGTDPAEILAAHGAALELSHAQGAVRLHAQAEALRAVLPI